MEDRFLVVVWDVLFEPLCTTGAQKVAVIGASRSRPTPKSL